MAALLCAYIKLLLITAALICTYLLHTYKHEEYQ